MLSAAMVARVQEALEKMCQDPDGAEAERTLDGWLVFDFQGRNPIMAALAGAEVVTGRRAFVYIAREGNPTAIIHCVDQESWRTWPEQWNRHVWVAREELAEFLRRLVGGKTIAMEISPLGAVPYVDCVPTGMMDLIRSLGVHVVPSASLVTAALSAWTQDDLASHQRAARIVAAIAGEAFQRVRDAGGAKVPANEWEIAQFIVGAFDRAGLRTEHAVAE